MGSSIRLSRVFAAAIVVCLSILLLSPTEVEGACDIPNGICYPFGLFQKSCRERCLDLNVNPNQNYYDGLCVPQPVIMSLYMDCMCCSYD